MREYGNTNLRCQLHTWATKSEVRTKANVVECEHCQVHLCIDCFRLFHTVPGLVSFKKKIGETMKKDYEYKMNKS